MSVKTVAVDDIGTVSLYKRKGARHIRLSISSKGEVRVTLPSWTPYAAALAFVKAKQEWIQSQRREPNQLIDGRTVGKAHHLRFISTSGSKPTTRVQANQVFVALPSGMEVTDPKSQEAASKACIRALKLEAENLLPKRVAELAWKHGFEYRSVAVKHMKGRWGSCNQNKDLVFNCFLMELPWELIDYVIMHELTHTVIMAHGAPFWDEVAKHVPQLPAVRKAMRTHQPTL